MLTPVRAASNASLSSHGQTEVIVASGLGRSAVAPTPAQAVEATDLNSAIAGKLNILLAAARERMFDALLDAINAASRALPLPRRESESNLAFASRLAEAIQKLPAARINEIETKLVGAGHTLPLRLIAEALKNPAGPQAARVIAYLETIRYKDRDLAARAVVRSYRQNDASPLRPEARPNILIQEEKLLSIAKAQQSPVGEAQAPLSTGRAVLLAPAVLVAELAEQPVKPAEAAYEEPARAEGNRLELPDAIDVQAMDPVSTETLTLVDEPTGVEAQIPAVRPDHSEPAIPKVWTGVLASMTEEASELIVAIIGEQETAMLLDDLAAVPATTETTTADTVAEKVPAPADLSEAATPLKLQQAVVSARLPVAEPAQIIHQQKDIVAQPQLLPADIAEVMEKSGLLKPIDGMPYTQHPYQFAKDGAQRRDGEMHRRDYEGSGCEGEQQADRGSDHREEEAEGQQRAEGVAPQDLPEVDAGTSGNAVADPVYALYQRMVGWE
ncbi:hypothetical protein AM571_CH00127 [Rhizobium etli 8C-3]|uniref:Uncharacterized protein n=2 Tax=Rhizobium TaxID=379 RepID=A0A1L5NYM1_RHIET|nr:MULTISPECIES: hypothetical protein [Rhizobium]APO72985.1 hypothetical protein AM571_CH00127 [Rhizobium etli 8C-3]TCU26909.1 hypothetical protein EV130_104527 [Rhizobium azibense]